jgi:hypothetical protein
MKWNKKRFLGVEDQETSRQQQLHHCIMRIYLISFL